MVAWRPHTDAIFHIRLATDYKNIITHRLDRGITYRIERLLCFTGVLYFNDFAKAAPRNRMLYARLYGIFTGNIGTLGSKVD